MTDLETRVRFTAVKEQAAQLGYAIKVEFLPNRRTPLHRAFAHALDGSEESTGRFLCSRSTSLDALEDGLEVLGEIVNSGEA